MTTKTSLTLDAGVEQLKGVGDKTRQLLNKIGIDRVQDLLFYLPLRYQDRTRIIPLGSLLPGQQCLIQGTIDLSQIVFGRRRTLLCQLSDGTGTLVLRFFHFNQTQKQQLSRGTLIRCYGQVRPGKKHLEMVHPEYKILYDETTPVDEALTPIYPLTEGLHQLKIRSLINQALALVDSFNHLELLPENIREKFNLYDLSSALLEVHHPQPDTDIQALQNGNHPAQQRLSFEELLAQLLHFKQVREQFQQQKSYSFTIAESTLEQFYQALDFSLTHAQQRAIQEIHQDIRHDIPMLRLLQGDVGSGKTLVAAVASISASRSGYQTAIMAPTELLAEQHYENFKQWMQALDINVIRLTGKLKNPELQEALATLRTDTSLIAIGTHALFQKSVEFHRLGLVIIDEQHRFGVNQRLELIQKNRESDKVPHQLVMSATPIPRTLTMTAYADLDVSIIDELPAGRTPVNTSIIANSKREDLIERLRQANQQGRQIYWVCALIEESESLQCEAATDTQKNLQQALPEITVGLVHGRMKADEKEQVINDFKNKQIQLLVATTVIEVGVNIPDASLMIIENSERMGLAQLHQLRGRVGRGSLQSDCILLYQPPLSALAKKRLDTIRSSTDGFKIAETDLQLRGPGDMLGTRQAGVTEYVVADLVRDADMLPNVQETAELLQEHYPELSAKLIRRWCHNQKDYTQV